MKELKKKENDTQLGSERPFLSRYERAAIPSIKAQLTFWSLLAAGVALDLWSKKAVFNALLQKQTHSISIIDGIFGLVLAQNNGAAFGLFSGRPYLLAVVSVIAVVVIVAIFLSSGNQHTLVHVALALFAAGVCGNLYDRIFNKGFVRDFIDVYYHQYHWPAFNVADTMLCVGVGVLILSSLSGRSYTKPDL